MVIWCVVVERPLACAHREMVDVKQSNLKLIDRARRITRAVLGPLTGPPTNLRLSVDLDDDGAVTRFIADHGGSVKRAIVAARWACGPTEAVSRLDDANGVLKIALAQG